MRERAAIAISDNTEKILQFAKNFVDNFKDDDDDTTVLPSTEEPTVEPTLPSTEHSTEPTFIPTDEQTESTTDLSNTSIPVETTTEGAAANIISFALILTAILINYLV